MSIVDISFVFLKALPSGYPGGFFYWNEKRGEFYSSKKS